MSDILATLKSGLYSSSIFFPEILKSISFSFSRSQLVFSHHVKDEARKEEYGKIDLNKIRFINTKVQDIFEVELDNGKVTKFGVSFEYDDTFNAFIVVAPKENSRKAVVITTWLAPKNQVKNITKKFRYVSQ